MTNGVKNKSEVSKKIKKISDFESKKENKGPKNDKSYLYNGKFTLEEINRLKDDIIQKELTEISIERLSEIKEGRDKLFGNYFEGKSDIVVNRCGSIIYC